MTERITYALVTAKGATIETFDDRKAALKAAVEKEDVFPGSEVFEITHYAPTRRRIWRQRAPLRLVAS